MKNILYLFLSVVFCLLPQTTKAESANDNQLKLWYNRPAGYWEEALPLGNGRLGAMVYGGIGHEELQLNEETIWTGSPYNNTNPNAKDSLAKIRQLIFEGKNVEAQKMCGPAICSTRGNGMAYQTVGSVHLDFDIKGYKEANDTAFLAKNTKANYYRDLNISNAIATTRFTAGGVTYTREAFSSFKDNIIILRLTASKKGCISFTARYTTPYKEGTYEMSNDKNILRFDGNAESLEGVPASVKFTSLLRPHVKGGKVTTTSNSVTVKNANEVILYISVGTNFKNYKDVSGDSYTEAMKYLRNSYAVDMEYNYSKANHVEKYKNFFDRVQLNLGDDTNKNIPTNERIENYSKKADPAFAALYFQFGRYLLICSSQPGGQAANLQGIWNYQRQAPWDGKYTTDINVEMNYWPAEPTNLEEMNEPMLQLIKECAEQGKQTAEMYGCRGWTLHHNTDIWRSTGAVDGPDWGIWPTCNAWFCQHLYDRYLFNLDKDYLAEIYPLMKSACEFYIDFLVREPNSGYLVVAPSYSPENTPKVNGKRSHRIVAGAAMDNQMVRDLFVNTIAAGKEMNEKAAFIDTLQNISKQLAPIMVGSWGQVQEWLDDYDDPRDNHRHTSHLWALFPGNQINYYKTPELHNAAIKTLEGRGDHSTGWSMGWKVCFWARLLDGNHAHKIITEQMNPCYGRGHGQMGGTYPNLFDAHPPFQIDGNFGCTAGIAEMLVQSHTDEIHILPALPDVWKDGTVKGLRLRGGFVLEELTWKNKVPTAIHIRSNAGKKLRIRIGNKVIEKDTNPGEELYL